MLCTKGRPGAIATTVGCHGWRCVRVQHYCHAGDVLLGVVPRDYITSMAVVLHLASTRPTLVASNQLRPLLRHVAFLVAHLYISLFAGQHMALVLLQVAAAGSSTEDMLGCNCGRASGRSSSSSTRKPAIHSKGCWSARAMPS